MIVATAFVAGQTEASQQLGSHLAGLLSPFPLYALILAAFAYHSDSPSAAIRVRKGMLEGLFLFVKLFLIVAEIIERAGPGPTLLQAITVALALPEITAWLRLHVSNVRKNRHSGASRNPEI